MALSPRRLIRLHAALERVPGGAHVFWWMLARTVPYTGSLGARVPILEPGHAEVRMSDRRRLRNHLGSIHAAALMNLAEAASGLAFLSLLPENVRAIVTSFTVRYLKKARGTLTAQARCSFAIESSEAEYRVPVKITDAGGDVVAEGEAVWRVRPEELRA